MLVDREPAGTKVDLWRKPSYFITSVPYVEGTEIDGRTVESDGETGTMVRFDSEQELADFWRRNREKIKRDAARAEEKGELVAIEQESSSESEKGKTKLRSDDGAVASDLHDDKSDASIAGAEAQLAEKRAIAEELKGVWEERTGVKVTLYDRVEDVADPDAQAQLKQGVGVAGWFNAATGEVGVYIPNIKGRRDVERTIIHEVVGHLGIKGLLGEKGHAAFLDSVWRMMSGIEKELRMDM